MTSPPTLASLMIEKKLSVGDHVHVVWKGLEMKGIMLPQPNPEASPFLSLKLSSGYNVGLALQHVSEIKKLEGQHEAFRLNSAEDAHGSHVKALDKPGISLIRAGGTIGSKVDYATAGVSPLMTPNEMLALIPEIGSFAHFDSITSPFSKLSENISHEDWIVLAKACFKELQKDSVSGILLTHGTDTLHYTSAALSYMIQDLNKPIVLVGSQRSSDRGSSDANHNLICAAHMALSSVAEVGICMHATTSDTDCFFLRGTKVRKLHTSRRDAFRPINDVPIATVTTDGKIDFLSEYQKRDASRKPVLNAVFNPNVALIKTFPGMAKEMITCYVEKGIEGLVIEGTGLGHVHSDWIPVIHSLTQRGVPVFITSQTVYGRVNLNVYSNGRLMQEAGAVGLEDMPSETAYVKLGWVLAQTRDLNEVRRRMLTPISGDMAPSSRVDTFRY